MSTFYVTFGQKYRRDPHPVMREAHPDGWLTVVAEDRDAAIVEVQRWIGEQYAFLYDADDFEPEWYPRGELLRIGGAR